MNNTILLMLLSFLLSLTGMPLAAQDLDEVLSRMDKVGGTLTSMRCDISQKKWTDILQEFDQGESGKFIFLREKGEVLIRKDIVRPMSNTLVVKEGQVLFYQPSVKQAQQYALGRHGDKAEFLLLGFGTNKEALREAYALRLLGPELVGGRKAFQLELKPKSGKVSAFFSTIVLWIDSELWVPVQQKLVEPTQDYLLISFSNIVLNPKIRVSDFNLKLPPEVKVLTN